MRFDIREYNKDKAQKELDKIFKELNGYENPCAIKDVDKKYIKKNRR